MSAVLKSCIKFKGLDSCLMSFSTEHDSKNKSLGRSSFNKSETKKSGLRVDEYKMPPIVDFDSNEAKQSDWDSIVCVHENLRLVTTWDFVKSTMGKHKLDHERFSTNEKQAISFSQAIATVIEFIFYFEAN
jgi:U3 small nucleolar RNA-associated protein 21